jgi:hypothetical protein
MPLLLLDAIKDGEIFEDQDHAIWYKHWSGLVELLAEKDDLCGASFFQSPPGDPFRPACIVHDRMYVHRKFFEVRGWNRKNIDDYFLKLSLEIAYKLPIEHLDWNIKMARSRHRIVRLIGWSFYYRN